MASEVDLLIEKVTSAHRTLDADGRPQLHPAWLDLPPEERIRAYEETVRARTLEAALDPDGLSTTGRQLLARLSGTGR